MSKLYELPALKLPSESPSTRQLILAYTDLITNLEIWLALSLDASDSAFHKPGHVKTPSQDTTPADLKPKPPTVSVKVSLRDSLTVAAQKKLDTAIQTLVSLRSHQSLLLEEKPLDARRTPQRPQVGVRQHELERDFLPDVARVASGEGTCNFRLHLGSNIRNI